VVVSSRSASAARAPHAVVWHELECGDYEADLALWLELAHSCAGPVMDVGAGTGRVALALARAGFAVTAVERDPVLLDALGAYEDGLTVERVCADARAFSLRRRDFGLCIVPMHTIQLFGERERRAAFMRCVRAHLRPGGVLAVAILTDAEPFDCSLGHIGPAPEDVRLGGLRFESASVRVAVDADTIVIERRRIIERCSGAERVFGPQRDIVELARVSAAQLHAEAAALGFEFDGTRSVPATDEHVGSEVVLVRA
jgi:SAM-dependent methyltransferase